MSVFFSISWEILGISDCNETRTHNHLVRKQTLNYLAKLPNDWAVLWVLICTVLLTACSYHATYMFQSESTLYSCLNVKEPLAQNRHEIWSLSDCNGTQTHNHLVCKRTRRAKWILNLFLKHSSCTCQEKLPRHTEEPNLTKQLVWRNFLSSFILYIYCSLHSI